MNRVSCQNCNKQVEQLFNQNLTSIFAYKVLIISEFIIFTRKKNKRMFNKIHYNLSLMTFRLISINNNDNYIYHIQ